VVSEELVVQVVEGRPPRVLPFLVPQKILSKNGCWMALGVRAAATPTCTWALVKTKHLYKVKAPSLATGRTEIRVFAERESIAGF
jgi:hypothetical protein